MRNKQNVRKKVLAGILSASMLVAQGMPVLAEDAENAGNVEITAETPENAGIAEVTAEAEAADAAENAAVIKEESGLTEGESFEDYNYYGGYKSDDGVWELYVYNDNTAIIKKFNGSTENVVIPSEIDGYSIIGISSYSGSDDKIFAGSDGIVRELTGTLTIESGIQTIPGGIFQNQSSLQGDLTIPSSVTSIGEGAFTNCAGFKGTLTIPSSATSKSSTYSNSFYGCSGFSRIVNNSKLSIPASDFAKAGTKFIEEATGKEVEYINKGTYKRIWSVTGVALNQTNLTLKAGDSFVLEAEVFPENADNKAVLWNSSDPEVAVVDVNGRVTAKKSGTTTITVKTVDGGETEVCSLRVVSYMPMLRLYNPNSGEHFYTGSEEEKNTLVSYGWKYEGVAWNAPDSSETPVYRLYNANAGDHHYTTSEEEKNDLVGYGWNYEGIGWYSEDAGDVPLYRLYDPATTKAGAHHYTASTEERDNLIGLGWKYEGIGWYGKR